MKDPLIQEARLTQDGWGDWREERGDAWLCQQGIEDWYEMPLHTPSVLWVVLSPYRDENNYRVGDHKGITRVIDDDPLAPYYSAFVSSMSIWIRRHLRVHSQYNFFIHVEVEHVSGRKRTRSRLRATRKLHATGAGEQPAQLRGS